jgi:hypothetical protein
VRGLCIRFSLRDSIKLNEAGLVAVQRIRIALCPLQNQYFSSAATHTRLSRWVRFGCADRAASAAGLPSIADSNARGTASVWGSLPSLERLGSTRPPLSLRSGFFQIVDPFRRYVDALSLTSVLMIAEPMFVQCADCHDCATPLPMIVDRAKRRHTSGSMKLRRSCGPAPNPWDIHMPAVQAG